jgi:hypothetical protein
MENLFFRKTIILFLNKSELICLLDYVNALDKLRYKRHLKEFVRAFAALLLTIKRKIPRLFSKAVCAIVSTFYPPAN